MKKYAVALSFYVEESADNLEAAKTAAINKVRYKGGILYELGDISAVDFEHKEGWDDE